jgi:hypothetical protein
MRTGISTVLGVMLALAPGVALGRADQEQPSQAESNMGCVERLEIPFYPPLATQARIEGTITASVVLSSEGVVQEIRTGVESKDGQAKKLFGLPVEQVIRQARFRSGCSGKTIRLVFHFNLTSISPSDPRASISFGYPNTFWIVSETPLIQPKADVGIEEPIRTTSCPSVQRNGLRIASNMEAVEFYAPRLANVTKISNLDFVEYYVWYGEKRDSLRLNFMFGPTVGGHSPRQLQDESINWTTRKWTCSSGIEGSEWRGTSPDGRRWRHLAISVAGFAAYEGVPPNAADYFDKILDTMCCGKCPFCK